MRERPKSRGDGESLKKVKAIVAGIGSAVLFVASYVIAWSARGYQLSGRPMPNGKGGFMTFREGYYIALLSFLVSLVWFMAAYKLWRRVPNSDHSLNEKESD